MKNSLIKYKSNNSTFDTLVRSIWNDALTDPFFGFTRNWRLEEVKDADKELVIEIELPRVKKEEVKVEALDKNSLRVEAKTNRLSYSRSYFFPDIDAEKASVKLEDGVLVITIPKASDTSPTTKVLEVK